MSECISNLLIGTGESVSNGNYGVVKYATTEPLVVGNTYTISAYVEDVECNGATPKLQMYDGESWWGTGYLEGNVPGMQAVTFTYQQPFPGHADPNNIFIYNTPPDHGEKRKAVLRQVMLVEGTEPAAWAPAEGEMLIGGVRL